MKMIKEIGLAIILAGLFQACEVETERKGWIERSAPRAVLNALLTPDSIARVHISRSLNGIGDNMDEPDYLKRTFINDAEVELYLNGVSKGKMRQEAGGFGFYSLPEVSIQAGDWVKVKAFTPKYGEIMSETLIPSPLGLISMDTLNHRSPESSEIFYNSMDLHLTLQDQPGEPNYYLISFGSSCLYKKNDSIVLLDTVGFYQCSFWSDISSTSESKVKKAPAGYMYYLSGGYSRISSTDDFLFTDEGRDGKQITLDFVFENLDYSYKDDTTSCTHTCHITLSSISESYYLYRYSIALQKEQDDVLGDFGLREPIPTYTNVKGGYGILSARQVQKYDIVLPYLSSYNWHEYLFQGK